jgi:hypothetical protein
MWRRAGESYNACIHKSASWTWCSCMSPFFHPPLLLSIQFMSLFCPIIYLSLFCRGWKLSPQRKQKNTSHLAHTKKRELVYAELFLVSKATSCYIFRAMYTSLLCACSYVVLSIFFHLSYCHCRIHLKPISVTPLSAPQFASHSRNVDHKKAVFTFNIFLFNPPVFMCISPIMVELFLPLHFSNWQSSEWIWCERLSGKNSLLLMLWWEFFPSSDWEKKKWKYMYMFECEYEIGFVLWYCCHCSWNANMKKVAAELSVYSEKKC